MQLSVDFGQIALIFVQLVALIITFFVHSRQLSAVDIEKRDRGVVGGQVTEALRVATLAMRGVELMETTHYKALAAKHAVLLEEIEHLKVRIAAFEETVQSLSNKLASRDRADAAAIRRANKEAEQDEPTLPKPKRGEVVDLETLKAMGMAVPLNTVSQQPDQNPPNAHAFGKVVRG